MKLTACKDCKHMISPFVNKTPPGGRTSFKCAAVKNEPIFDPLEGIFEQPKQKYCREVNGGNCVFFEVRE